MTRKILTWTVLVVVSALMVLNTNTRTRHEEARLADMKAQINIEKSRIRVLQAEWSMLQSPERLEQLAARHLTHLGRVSPKQLANADTLSIKLSAPMPAIAVAKLERNQTQLKTAPSNAHTPAPAAIEDKDDIAMLIDTTEAKTLVASLER